jgi:lipopolysaccharide/colanic/teichoic acid biosynthesis glycosyltransferase
MGRISSQVTDFRTALTRERARADRTEHEFSVLVLEGQAVRNTQLATDLIDTLSKRIRTVDEIGWFDKGRIGIILPDTKSNGAVKLAQDIRRMTMPSPPNVTVFTYPGQWLPEETPTIRPITGASGHPSGVFVGPADALFDSGMPLWKRTLDIVGAAAALVVLFPLFVLVAATIALVSRGPIFWKQTRVGYQGRPFTIWKFRTMKVGADTRLHEAHFEQLMAADAPLTKLDVKGDPRIIPLGNFIRRCCLDELPQLFNVLIGTMSLVGPRPCLAFAVSQYLPWQRMRCDAYPGMTGLWQVSGKNRTTFKEMLRLDIEYVQQRSLALDLSIILRTIPAIFRELFDVVPAGKTESASPSTARHVLKIVNGGRKA